MGDISRFYVGDIMTDQNQINTVDSMLPIPQLFAFGLQHVLAMYAGAVAVPIIVAQAMNLPVEDLIRLITADLFTCGIATLIQTLGFGNIGGRIPMIQGVTFASVGPMTMIGAQHGMTAIYGAITANKKIILTQGGPAILTLLSLIIPLF